MSLQCLDLVVGCLQWACGDGVVVPSQEAALEEFEGLGDVCEHSDSGCLGSADPIFQEGFGGWLVGLFPQQPQILLHVVGSGQRFIECKCLGKPLTFVPPILEVFGVFDEQPSSPFQDLLLEKISGFPIQIAPERGEFVVVEFDDMEVVKDDDGLGEVPSHSLDVRIGHVNGHRLNVCSGFVHAFEEWLKGPDILAFTHEDHRTAGQVQDHRYKLVSPSEGDLVYGNAPQMAKLRLGEFPAQVTLLDVLDHVPTHAQMTSDLAYIYRYTPDADDDREDETRLLVSFLGDLRPKIFEADLNAVQNPPVSNRPLAADRNIIC